jgi:hypothetical protein
VKAKKKNQFKFVEIYSVCNSLITLLIMQRLKQSLVKAVSAIIVVYIKVAVNYDKVE